MDASLSSLFDEPDASRTPSRSPSRLDFCMEGLDGSPMESVCTCAHDNFAFTFIGEDAFVADVAPLDDPCLPLVDPPQAVKSHTHENVDMIHTRPAPSEHSMNEVIVEPQAPIPVRLSSVQLQLDAREPTPPPRTTTQRLDYPHHGFSRSALLQQKTLWSSRHEEWAEWRSRMEQNETHKHVAVGNNAYMGVAAIPRPSIVENPPPYMRTPPSGLERDLSDHRERNHQNVHSSIFPRVGDISALRDPYSVNIDRCFFRYPLWTLHKTLYIFSMHQRSAVPAPSSSVYDTTQVRSTMSLSTSSSHTSSTFGDQESDSTLAAEDSPIPNTPHSLDSSRNASPPHGPPSWCHFCSWELSWYARWELLIGLFQRDCIKGCTLDMSTELAAPPEYGTSPPSSRAPTFGRGVEEDQSGGDDEDDYGTLLSSSSFSVDFEEECERAMAFYSREPKYAGTAS